MSNQTREEILLEITESTLSAIVKAIHVTFNVHQTTINSLSHIDCNSHSNTSQTINERCHFCFGIEHWYKNCKYIPKNYRNLCFRCWMPDHLDGECDIQVKPPWMTDNEYERFEKLKEVNKYGYEMISSLGNEMAYVGFRFWTLETPKQKDFIGYFYFIS
ncbi:hypothetical protein C1645_814940 [Glomus cerebriforme]|uniref:CCHC-type domain-containing protein n=1 Tax=Glomus cerebriforme TaxID=658196 RepID=A0A397TER8_9GLOM|nr:hypothetical protein C1645_814940 [Glomus cerebriforme]